MFQVCKYDLKFKNCSVPLKWVRNRLAVRSCWGAWRLALVGGGGGDGTRWVLSTSHLNTAAFPSARSIPLDYELLNTELYASTRQLTGLSYRLGPDTGYNRSLLLSRHSPMHNPDEEQFPQGEKSLKSSEKTLH